MRTRFGSRLRAAVDDARVARGLGIPVGVVFAATFAVGSGLAGLGGALGVELLGLDPYFPLKFMIYFLIVVTVGGTSGIMGPFVAALLLGIADVAGKYYLSSALGGFVIYVVLIVVLVLGPTACSPGTMTRRQMIAAQGLARRGALAGARDRLLAAGLRRAVPAAGQAPAAERGGDPRPVRALARPDPGLCRHHLAGPCRLLRHGRLCRRAFLQARDARSAGRPLRRHGARPRCWACSPASSCCAAATSRASW